MNELFQMKEYEKVFAVFEAFTAYLEKELATTQVKPKLIEKKKIGTYLKSQPISLGQLRLVVHSLYKIVRNDFIPLNL